MSRTAEAVSIGHPDKIADYISSFILDKLITIDPHIRYAVEVMIKDNTVILGGEIGGNIDINTIDFHEYVRDALNNIGYTEYYYDRWGDNTINPSELNVINKIGIQSSQIATGVEQNGWGDQGVFVGYACVGPDNIGYAHYLAHNLAARLYQTARFRQKWGFRIGLDIKTQVTIDDTGDIETVIVAAPVLDARSKKLVMDEILNEMPRKPKNIIINGAGEYTRHASIADCGITGRKLAVDFYSTYAPVGGGAPWTKDGTKADLTLNLYARELALENLRDNDECTVYLSSCIGKSNMPGAMIKTVKDGVITTREITCSVTPHELIVRYNLDTPIYADLCMNGLFSIKPNKVTI